MSDYLDLGVVRIQQWLTRTPWLRGRRGASTMLSTATGKDAVDRVLGKDLAGMAEHNAEVGNVDGVVSLRLHATDPDSVERVENALVAHLREALPAASLQVNHWTGRSYVDARQNGSPEFHHEWPAAVAEWPPGRPCQWCQTWPATAVVNEGTREDNKDLAMCVDCLERRDPKNAGYNTSPKHLPGPERELSSRAEEQSLPSDLPDEFQELASMDGRHETHVATVHADGNAIGTFIGQVRKKNPDAERDLATAIHEATWGALLDAVALVQEPGDTTKLPIIPHLVGGDDVLVSVPARRGWAFTSAFQECFTERLRESEKIPRLPVEFPTASVGLVFHHRTTPFFMFTELGEKLLKRAKSEHRGTKPALAWQDTTRDGSDPVPRRSVLHTTLGSYWSSLRELAGLAQSTRQRLATASRAHDENSETMHEHINRLGLMPTVAPFLDGGAINLNNALEMVRWWKP